jgi:hypothetical protein
MSSTAIFSFLFGCHSEPLEWRWSKDKASLDYCTKQHLTDYEVELIPNQPFDTSINIRTKQDHNLIYSLRGGHDSTVFTRWKDLLYIADYSPIATGCKVIALDLKTGKELWQSQLQGIGDTGHSKYLNLVNIETDGLRIIVTGNEVHGRYIEHLDRKSGKFLANKKLDADMKSLLGK